jgi:hypothetical protein
MLLALFGLHVFKPLVRPLDGEAGIQQLGGERDGWLVGFPQFAAVLALQRAEDDFGAS